MESKTMKTEDLWTSQTVDIYQEHKNQQGLKFLGYY